MKTTLQPIFRLSFIVICLVLVSCKKDPQPQSELENLYFGTYHGKMLNARDEIIGSVVWQIYKGPDDVITINHLDTSVNGQTRLMEFKNVRFVDSKSIEFEGNVTAGRCEGIGVLTYNTLSITLKIISGNGTVAGESFDLVKV